MGEVLGTAGYIRNCSLDEGNKIVSKSRAASRELRLPRSGKRASAWRGEQRQGGGGGGGPGRGTARGRGATDKFCCSTSVQPLYDLAAEIIALLHPLCIPHLIVQPDRQGALLMKCSL